ncbi:putative transmembrane protein [Wufeng Typhlomys cinereus jeilongvirus 1]|uniref:Transmembrane protein n=1 Tax=Wufeng Typhlomys cinereus jeilongvirus 1 TaxID=2928989 RepID=A0A8T9KN63_9MONO|nr:putative transmembrane protein [Wufeng Typhlomys cinereus jeilongvirus 1]
MSHFGSEDSLQSEHTYQNMDVGHHLVSYSRDNGVVVPRRVGAMRSRGMTQQTITHRDTCSVIVLASLLSMLIYLCSGQTYLIYLKVIEQERNENRVDLPLWGSDRDTKSVLNVIQTKLDHLVNSVTYQIPKSIHDSIKETSKTLVQGFKDLEDYMKNAPLDFEVNLGDKKSVKFRRKGVTKGCQKKVSYPIIGGLEPTDANDESGDS